MEANELSETANNIISQASNWNFEGDCKILQWMEQISQTLEARAKNTVQSLDQLTGNINRAQIDLENTQNSLTALQYSQYVEMRCQEETTLETENLPKIEEQQKPSQQEVLQVFLQNNIKMLHNCHDKFNFLEESDEDEGNTAAAENCIYQPRNPYNDRLLPHIFGTKMWKEQGNVGLEDDTVLDYSGDEKSEVYSISSSSSAESGGRDSPESHLTANTSQWTSSASLNNELSNASKTMKFVPSISNTPSVSSLPLDTTNIKLGVQNEPVLANVTPEAVINVETLQPTKKRTLNLFDDHDYKNLISEIVEKTQSSGNSKSLQFQAEKSKVDLFASDESLSNQEKIQPPNSAQTQKIASVNLFDSPTEPVHDLFQDFEQPEVAKTPKQTTFMKTKLSAKSLFDDDDEDTDFLNIFAKKPQNSTKNSDLKTTKPLFGNDELDKQEIIKDQITARSQTLETNKALKPQDTNRPTDFTKPTQPTKSLFFDDNDEDDDFFVRTSHHSNIAKNLERPKNTSFPTFLSTEPPEDNESHNQKHQTPKAKSFEVDDDDDFDHMFGSRKYEKKTQIAKTNLKPDLFADNYNTPNVAENTDKIEQNSIHEQINEAEILIMAKSDQEKEQVKPNLTREMDESDDVFEKLFPSKNERQVLPPKDSLNENSDNNLSTDHKKPTVELPDKLETPATEHEKSNTVVENQTTKANVAKEHSFEKAEVSLKLPTEEQHLTKETTQFSSADLFESSSTQNTYNSSAWVTEPPLDDPPVNIIKETVEHSEEDDDFLSIFNKKKNLPKLFDDNIKSKEENTTTHEVTLGSESTEKQTSHTKAESIQSTVKETTQLSQKNLFEESPKRNETNEQIILTPESTENTTQSTNFETDNRQKTPAFDNFSPLFLDEPPDDDFLQTISTSSSNNTAPAPAAYSADHDFYESTKQSGNSDTKTEESQQIHTGYNIRLFDESPPDDSEQDNEKVEKMKPETLKQTNEPTKTNTLSNLFASDKFVSFLDEPPAEESVNKFTEKSTDEQFNKPIRSVTAKVQAFEKPFSTEETAKEPSPAVSKLKLPKIDINVQALLPNAGGKSIKRNVETEKVVDELQHTEIKVDQSTPKISEAPTATKNYANEPEKAHLLPSLCKSRVRVPVKRKSSTRAARQQSYRQTLQAEVQTSHENTPIEDDLEEKSSNKVRTPNQVQTTTKQAQQKPLSITNSARETATLFTKEQPTSTKFIESATAQPPKKQSTQSAPTLKPNQKSLPQPTSLLVPKTAAAFTQSTPVVTQTLVAPKVKSANKLFGDSDDDGDDEFFSKLAQPKIPAVPIEKSATVTPQFSYEDSDDDLFASNAAKRNKPALITALTKPQTTATSQATAVSKPTSSTPKPAERSTAKAKTLFDSDSSNDDDNVDDLFKASKPTKPTFQATTKTSTVIDSTKPSASQPLPSKIKSLFSDSDDDDDDLFGSGASKLKNTRVGSVATTAKDPLGTQQQKTQKENLPPIKTSDNPLADLLE